MSEPKLAQDKSTWVTDQQQQELADAIDDLLDSGEFNAEVRKKHFDAGFPITYMSDEESNIMITEYPDGKIEKERVEEDD